MNTTAKLGALLFANLAFALSIKNLWGTTAGALAFTGWMVFVALALVVKRLLVAR